jgi:CrcB protein
MKALLIVGAGSFIGGAGRYLVSMLINRYTTVIFPYGTLVVNILGCLIIGLVMGLFMKGSLSEGWRLFLATGICGGFTTFSTFAYENVNLIHFSEYLYMLMYILLSVALGLTATYLGLTIAKAI